MIAIIDYGMGNLRSVQKAFEKVGAAAKVTQNAEDIANARAVVLPGVGAIQPAMDRLKAFGLIEVIKNVVAHGKSFLGICLGFQLLFEKSDEGGSVCGLGILPGEVKRFDSLKIPQIGWNQLVIKRPDCPILKAVEPLANVYFCHSYFVKPAEQGIVATTTDYGIEFTSSVWQDNIFGVQFHPEKSQKVGLRILRNFVEIST